MDDYIDQRRFYCKYNMYLPSRYIHRQSSLVMARRHFRTNLPDQNSSQILHRM